MLVILIKCIYFTVTNCYLLIRMTTVVTTAARKTKAPKTPRAMMAPKTKQDVTLL